MHPALRLGLLALLAACACFVLLSACGSLRTTKTALFVPLPPPKPVVREARRKPYAPPKAGPVVEFKEAPAPIDWSERAALLPRDAVGGIDWVTALNAKAIEPKSSLATDGEPEPELDLDVELVPQDTPDFKVTYPHKIHTSLLSCASCHTEIFQMQAGADPITMEKILGGEYCGRCHGKVAFDPTTACQRCHKAMPQ